MRPPRRFRPLPLAAARIAGFWREAWRNWRLVLDWTVILYIALPGLFVFANVYRDAWDHTPAWFGYFRPQLVFALLGALMMRARLRTFADPGDGLFLRRNARWTRTLLAVGFAYTFAARLLLSAAALCALFPVLQIGLHWTAGEGLYAALASALFGFVCALARDRIERRRTGWRRIAVLWLMRAASVAAWTWLMTAASGRDESGVWASPARLALLVPMLAGAAVLLWRRTKAKGTFLQEIAAENAAYMDCTRLLLKYSAGIRSKPQGRRPLLSLAGRRLFRRRELAWRIAELGVKASLREGENIGTLAQLALFAGAALLLVPPLLGFAVWLALGALAQLWLHGQWRRWAEERFVAMLPLPPEAMREAESLGRLVFFLPLFEWWGLALGAKFGWTYGGWGWLACAALLAAGWPIGRFLNDAASQFWLQRSRRRSGLV